MTKQQVAFPDHGTLCLMTQIWANCEITERLLITTARQSVGQSAYAQHSFA